MSRNVPLVRRTALAVLAALVALPAVAEETAAKPKLVIEETSYSGGEIPKGEPLIHDFKVKNEGTADLQILTVKPACGCTTPGFDKIIPPGGEGKISLKVDTAKFKGPISKSASVTTNDPAQPTLRLVLNATVKTFVDVLPRDAVTFRQYRGEEKKQELTIRSNEEGDFEIKDVTVNGDDIKYELTRTEGQPEYKLALWLDKGTAIGNVSGSVKLLTNSTKEPQVNVSVRGSVLGQINVNPSTLYFRVDGGKRELEVTSATLNMRAEGNLESDVVTKLSQGEKLAVVQSGKEWSKVKTADGKEGFVFNELVEPVSASSPGSIQSKVLNVTHRQSGEFKITSSEVSGQKIDPEALKIEAEPGQDGSSYRVTVTYEGDLEKGNYTGRVVLGTTDTEEPSIEVPLYIVVT